MTLVVTHQQHNVWLFHQPEQLLHDCNRISPAVEVVSDEHVERLRVEVRKGLIKGSRTGMNVADDFDLGVVADVAHLPVK